MNHFSPFIFPVTGVTFKKEAVDKVVEGDSVSLIRDPENEFDVNAIVVLINGSQVGFVPAALAVRLSKSRANSWLGEVERVLVHEGNKGLRVKVNEEIDVSKEEQKIAQVVYSVSGRYLGELLDVSGRKARIKASTGRTITYPVDVITIK